MFCVVYYNLMLSWFIIALIKQSKFKIILKNVNQHVNQDVLCCVLQFNAKLVYNCLDKTVKIQDNIKKK